MSSESPDLREHERFSAFAFWSAAAAPPFVLGELALYAWLGYRPFLSAAALTVATGGLNAYGVWLARRRKRKQAVLALCVSLLSVSLGGMALMPWQTALPLLPVTVAVLSLPELQGDRRKNWVIAAASATYVATMAMGLWLPSAPGLPQDIERGFAAITHATTTALLVLLVTQRAGWLTESVQQLQLTLDSLSEGVIATDGTGRISRMNPVAERLTGWSRAEALGKNLSEVFVVDAVSMLRRRDGTEIPIAESTAPMRALDNSTGESQGAVLVFRDVTREREAQAAIEAGASRFRQIAAASVEGIWQVDAQGKTTYASRRMAEILGYETEAFIEGHAVEFIRTPDNPGHVAATMARRRAGVSERYEIQLRRADGSGVWCMISSIPLTDPRGQFEGALALVTDITDRRRSEDELRRSEQRFRSLVEHVADVITLHDPDGRVRWVTPSIEHVLGWSADDLVGRRLTERVIHPEDAGRFEAALQSARENPGRPVAVPFRSRHADGRWRSMEASVTDLLADIDLSALVFVQRDVTARVEMEARLAIADRMASVGTLAAGVAHEINNPLSYVMANVALAAERVEETGPEALRSWLADALEGIERVRVVVGQLRAFSRSDQADPGPSDLNEVLESALKIADNEIRHRARICRQLTPVPPVRGDAGRLGQVALNLLINAAQAIPVGNVEQHEIRVSTQLQGELVVAEVSDTGVGMSPEVQSRVFDPFFTTKPVGEGTGVGLAIVHGIVSSLGGRIELESAPGRGSTFRVWLPVGTPAPRPAVPASPAPPAPASRRYRILVVDDEPMIGTVVSRTLRQTHDVLAVTRASEALERLNTEPFDAILCDLMMPEMSGIELHRHLARHAPEHARRMVFVTGGAFTEEATSFLEVVTNPVIEKPFDRSRLVEAIAAVARDN